MTVYIISILDIVILIFLISVISLGVALSVVPPIHATVPEKLNLVHLSAFVNWFRESFPVASGSSQKVCFTLIKF
jgi:hypothetical protein